MARRRRWGESEASERAKNARMWEEEEDWSEWRWRWSCWRRRAEKEEASDKA